MGQYPIPQFIESEGKIVSFLTFRQFFILVGGGAICLLFYYILPFFLFIIFTIFIGLLVFGVAFLKIDNTSIVTILFNFLRFSTESKDYTWKRHEAKNMKNIIASNSRASRLDNTKKIIELRKKK